jgi:hypothetical protein
VITLRKFEGNRENKRAFRRTNKRSEKKKLSLQQKKHVTDRGLKRSALI